MAERYYWLKLPRDFFKRHDMTIIEALPDGKEMVLLYVKMLCEAIDHEGRLRFNESIPYTAETLAAIMRTDKAIMERALELFSGLQMVEVEPDGTIFMKQVLQMIGSETKGAERVRRHRESVTETLQCNGQALHCNSGVTECNADVTQEKEKEIDIEKEKERDKEKESGRSRFTPPTLDDVKAYTKEKGINMDEEAFIDFYSSKGWKVGSGKMADWKAAVRNWVRHDQKWAKERSYTKESSKPAQMSNYTPRDYSNFDFDSLYRDPSSDEKEEAL